MLAQLSLRAHQVFFLGAGLASAFAWRACKRALAVPVPLLARPLHGWACTQVGREVASLGRFADQDDVDCIKDLLQNWIKLLQTDATEVGAVHQH